MGGPGVHTLKRVTLCGVALLLIACMADGAPTNEEPVLTFDPEKEIYSEAAAVAEWLHSLPRVDWKGNNVSNTFAPNSTEYMESMGVIASGPAAIAVFSLFAGLFFYAGRYCCDCCGGLDAKEKGYTKSEIFWPALFLTIIAVISTAACVVGYVGNTRFRGGLQDFTNNIIDAATDVYEQSSYVVQELQALNHTVSVPTAIEEIPKVIGKTLEQATDIRTEIFDYDEYRLIAINAGYAVTILCGLLGILAWLLKRGGLAKLMTPFCFLCLFFMWFSVAINVPVAVMTSDLCPAVDAYVQTSEPTPAVEYFVKCNGNTTFEVAFQFADEQRENMKELVKELKKEKQTPEVKEEIVQLNNVIEDYGLVLHKLTYISNCSAIHEAYEVNQGILCGNVLSSLCLIWISQGVIGFLFLFGSCFSVMGWKRFVRDNSQDRKKEMIRFSTDTSSRLFPSSGSASMKRQSTSGNPSAQPLLAEYTLTVKYE